MYVLGKQKKGTYETRQAKEAIRRLAESSPQANEHKLS